MNMKHRVDPELIESLELMDAATNGGIDLHDIPAIRRLTRELAEFGKANMPPIEGVSMQKRNIPGPEGAPDVTVLVFRPENKPGNLPALIWIHGGGYVLGSAEQDEMIARQLSKEAECAVIAVDYRLAPEHPYPAAIEDCYAVLKWASDFAHEMKIDKSRLVVGGASAGGGLAAGLALLARDRKEVDIQFQLLIYPMIDDGNVLPTSAAHPETFIWSRESNLIGWRSYLGCEPGGKEIPMYAAPFRAEDLAGLPPAIILVGELDLFLNENIEYTQGLIKADVHTELHVYPGAYHGFNSFAPDADVSKRCNAELLSALKRALHLNMDQ